MILSDQLKEELGVALNESTLLGVELNPEERIVGATFRVLTLPQTGPMPEDSRVQFVFQPVGRVAASLRLGRWDDQTATVQSLEPSELLSAVKNLEGPLYGWEFFDIHEQELEYWGDRLSLDWRSGADGLSHSISLFAGDDPHLDLSVWFDDFIIKDAAGVRIQVSEFVAGGRRWWEALRAGDPRAAGQGIFPLRG